MCVCDPPLPHPNEWAAGQGWYSGEGSRHVPADHHS